MRIYEAERVTVSRIIVSIFQHVCFCCAVITGVLTLSMPQVLWVEAVFWASLGLTVYFGIFKVMFKYWEDEHNGKS